MKLILGSLFIVLVLALSAVTSTAAQPAVLPGIKVSFLQNGLGAFAQQITPDLVNSMVKRLAIPAQAGNKDGVTYNISNIAAGNISFKSVDVELSSKGGFAISVADATGALTFDWAYTFLGLGDHGSAQVLVGGIKFQLLILVGANNGYPTTQTGQVSVELSQLTLVLHGGASWLYDFILGLVNFFLKSAVESAVQSAITKTINVDVNAQLSQLPLKMMLPPKNVTTVDVTFLNAPNITNQFAVNNIKGEFTVTGSDAHSPSRPSKMPDFVNPNSMLQVLVNQYVFDTACWAYYKAGVLVFNMTKQDVPSWSPITLNTNSFSFFLPSLYSICPGCDMTIEFELSRPPQVYLNTTGEQGILTNVGAEMLVNVIEKNGTVMPVFVLGVDLSLNLELSINMSYTPPVIEGQFFYSKFNASIISSKIGQFDLSALDFAMNFLFNSVVIPLVNEYLVDIGIPIPSLPGVELANPKLAYISGFAAFYTDLKPAVPKRN